MDRISRIYRKYNKGMRITAALLIGCMLFADASLYLSVTSDNLPYDNKGGNTVPISDDDYVVNENHLLDVAMADGEYNGNNSDRENGIQSTIISVEGKRLFNILEIVPTEKKGVVGYTIGGCEPFEVAEPGPGDKFTKKELKQAAMDALVNPNPGSNDGNDQNIVNNKCPANYLKELRQKLKEGNGDLYPFEFEHSKVYNGYYKYVGHNNGYFSVENKDSSNPTVKSRFYSSGGNYDYIFVYDQVSDDANDVNVTNHKRIRYINNEKFIKEWLGKTEEDKEKYEFEVTTRTPVSVTLADIERADLILINDARKGDSYKFALKIQNSILGKPEDLDDGLHFYSPEDDGVITPRENRIDFNDFEKVIRIYERVVVREDAALVAEKTCCTTFGGGEIQEINTNVRKLMFMLFYVQCGNTKQKGRDLFSDYFKRYTSQPGTEYLEKRRQHLEDPQNYPVDYRAASLKRNTSDPTQPGYYYMHSHASYHVGHPLVLDSNTAISGVDTTSYVYVTDSGNRNVTLPKLDNEGNIIPLHDQNVVKQNQLTIQRIDDYQFNDAGIEFQRNSSEPGRYYKSGDIYEYKYCYESMSNTTDYIYIDNDGRLVIDAKYSSDQQYNADYKNYWYRIDADYSVEGYAFRRRKWAPRTYDIDDPWPWDSSGGGKPLSVWLMHRTSEGNNYDCNLHMWYDYYDMANLAGIDKYTTVKQPPFGETFKNQSLMEENGFFKGSWIKNALAGREIKREETDKNHIVNTSEKDYYLSMNITNGDGFNKKSNSGQNNKTLYYNQYEVKKNESGVITEYPAIPLHIKVRSTCPIVSISMKKASATDNLVSYDFDKYDVKKGEKIISGTSRYGTIKLSSEGVNGAYTSKTDAGTPIYTFTGTIPNDVVALSEFYNNRNVKLKVIMTVILPDDTEKSVEDTITIVKRDFFMLD